MRGDDSTTMEHRIDSQRFGITVGPVQYWWSRDRLLAFYEAVAGSVADCVVLGDVVCSRRNDVKLADWMALGRELRAAGKQVVLATRTLVMTEAELRAVRALAEQEEFAVEAGDASAVQLLAQAAGRRPGALPFVLGPHINVYSRDALVEWGGMGAARWVAAVELGLDAIAGINPAADRVRGAGADIATEVWAFGRLPLAFSARCFTARHHRLSKDVCAFRCRDDADGLLVRSAEAQEFLCLNGTQVQSAGMHALIAPPQELRAAGVDRLRLSPCSRGFVEVLNAFDACYHHGRAADETLAEIRALELPGLLVDGYAHGQAGMRLVAEARPVWQ